MFTILGTLGVQSVPTEEVCEIVLCLFPLAFAIGKSNAADYSNFVGECEGRYVSSDGDKKCDRDLSVRIRKISKGLNIGRVTTTYKNATPKTKSYSIDFLESDRANIAGPAQKKNVFGGRDPLDPMKGEPDAWA